MPLILQFFPHDFNGAELHDFNFEKANKINLEHGFSALTLMKMIKLIEEQKDVTRTENTSDAFLAFRGGVFSISVISFLRVRNMQPILCWLWFRHDP